MIDEIDYWREPEITCPYCGHKDDNSWERGMNGGDSEHVECGVCEKQFEVECDIIVTYTSKPIVTPPSGVEGGAAPPDGGKE